MLHIQSGTDEDITLHQTAESFYYDLQGQFQVEAKRLSIKEIWRKPLCAEAKIKKMKEKAEGGKEENNQREVCT